MRLPILLLALSSLGSECRSEEAAPSTSAKDDPSILYTEPGDPFTLEPASSGQLADNEALRFPIPPEERTRRGGRLLAGKISGGTMSVSYLNDTKDTAYIGGSGFRSPHFFLEIHQGEKWKYSPNHMNCGTGAYLPPVPPGYGFSFHVRLPAGPETFRLRMQCLSSLDKQGRRRITEVQMPAVDPVKAMIRDSESIVEIAIHEEELKSVKIEKSDDEENPWGEEDETRYSFLVKRSVVTGVHKGTMRPGDKVEYIEDLDDPIQSTGTFHRTVEGEQRILFITEDAGKLENGTFVMEAGGHRSMKTAEIRNNPAWRESSQLEKERGGRKTK